MPQLSVGELCAGYGGLGLAVEQAFQARLAWVSEHEPAPSKILARHWPDIPNHGDMTKIDWASIEPVDIISGGTPCQDLSHAGKRRGMSEGTRSNLWANMREAIATIQPGYVVWENVRGAYSAKAASDLEFCPGCMGNPGDQKSALRALGRVLGDLSDLGFDSQWRGLRAADVGAPHARFRIFVLATRRTAHDPGGLRRGETVEHHGGGEAAHDGAGVPNEPNRDAHGIRPERETAPIPADIRHERTREARNGRARPANSGKPAADINWGAYEPAVRRWESALGRQAPAPTEPTGRNGKHQLSARFTEWMMGVPNGWICDTPGVNRNEAIKAAGNGVVPQQAAAALTDMLR